MSKLGKLGSGRHKSWPVATLAVGENSDIPRSDSTKVPAQNRSRSCLWSGPKSTHTSKSTSYNPKSTFHDLESFDIVDLGRKKRRQEEAQAIECKAFSQQPSPGWRHLPRAAASSSGASSPRECHSSLPLGDDSPTSHSAWEMVQYRGRQTRVSQVGSAVVDKHARCRFSSQSCGMRSLEVPRKSVSWLLLSSFRCC